MKDYYRIGNKSENDIIIRGEGGSINHAEIKYERGFWVLINLEESEPIYVNEVIVKTPYELSKYDKIRLYNQTIYWSDYLYEGERQELSLKDLFSYHGRISRSNFRALSLLVFGLSICILFLPGLVVGSLNWVTRRGFQTIEPNSIDIIQHLAPIIYIIGFGLLVILFLVLGIKRIRDTGKPIWQLWVPIYNLKLLYLSLSEK